MGVNQLRCGLRLGFARYGNPFRNGSDLQAPVKIVQHLHQFRFGNDAGNVMPNGVAQNGGFNPWKTFGDVFHHALPDGSEGVSVVENKRGQFLGFPADVESRDQRQVLGEGFFPKPTGGLVRLGVRLVGSLLRVPPLQPRHDIRCG